jgi:predicted TIM-barrel fold metal-dependent hydrolase
MYQDLHIVDFHVHFPTSKPMMGGSYADHGEHPRGPDQAAVIRSWTKMYNQEWRLAWDFPQPEADGRSDEEQADRWAAEVERYGLDRVVFVTGGGNDNLAAAVARHTDKFVAFAHHNLFAPDAAAELERAVTQLGFRGYKLLAPALEKPIDDKSAWPVWEVAEQYDIPVLIHFGILGSGGGVAWHENINPLRLHDVARAFPTVMFVVPHFGCGYLRETLQLCWSCANIYVDSSGSNQWVRWMPEELTTKMLFRKYLETIGPERLIFATDSSWFPRGFAVRYLQDQLRDCRELNVSHEALQAVFGGNAARLLKLEPGERR